MPKRWGKNSAFGFYNARGKNVRWSWSARSEDGKTVVLTLWKDLIEDRAGKIVYAEIDRGNLAAWIDKPGNHERIENLKWAQDNCDDIFRVVTAVAKDPNPYSRDIDYCYPEPELRMRVTYRNEKTGEFRAEQV
jgi:hypothetical protein